MRGGTWRRIDCRSSTVTDITRTQVAGRSSRQARAAVHASVAFHLLLHSPKPKTKTNPAQHTREEKIHPIDRSNRSGRKHFMPENLPTGIHRSTYVVGVVLAASIDGDLYVRNLTTRIITDGYPLVLMAVYHRHCSNVAAVDGWIDCRCGSERAPCDGLE
jgi:hypothetical protein